MPRAIHVNTANQQELLEVPGLRAEDAAAIIRFRHAHGPIADAAQLSRVLGGGATWTRRRVNTSTSLRPTRRHRKRPALSEASEKRAKLTPEPSQTAPSG